MQVEKIEKAREMKEELAVSSMNILRNAWITQENARLLKKLVRAETALKDLTSVCGRRARRSGSTDASVGGLQRNPLIEKLSDVRKRMRDARNLEEQRVR